MIKRGSISRIFSTFALDFSSQNKKNEKKVTVPVQSFRDYRT